MGWKICKYAKKEGQIDRYLKKLVWLRRKSGNPGLWWLSTVFFTKDGKPKPIPTRPKRDFYFSKSSLGTIRPNLTHPVASLRAYKPYHTCFVLIGAKMGRWEARPENSAIWQRARTQYHRCFQDWNLTCLVEYTVYGIRCGAHSSSVRSFIIERTPAGREP